MSHSPCGTSNCFFSLAVVQGFPNLFFSWGWLSVSCCSSVVSPCAPGAPRAAEQQRGRDGVTLALGTGESRSSGVQGSSEPPESLEEMGTEWFSCVSAQCVCECELPSLCSPPSLYSSSPPSSRKAAAAPLCRARRSQRGSIWHLLQHSLPRHPFPVSSRSAENQDLPPPCSWQRAARVPLLRGLQITSGTPQFGNPWYSIIIFL